MRAPNGGHAKNAGDFAGHRFTEGLAGPTPRPSYSPPASSASPRLCSRLGLCALLCLHLAGFAWAQKGGADLSEASLETLMNIEVTSASKKQEKLSQTAAAIFVITQEDVRRSGATSIPELLRMVPGLNVAHIDANKWAISARGFNDRFANKMLVLMDGRTVYTPLFSGVYWDVQDTLLEDIERIEVIRGPGATLWGANAVNGVINVITKQAKDTQGGLVTAGAGNQERGFSAVRYGGKLNGRGYYRFFAKYVNRDNFANPSGQDAADGWAILRGGFRTDWNLTSRDSLTVQGDFYNGSAGETVPGVTSLSPPITGFFDDRNHLAGGDLLGRWNHKFSARSDTTLQLYYDRSNRRDTQLGEVRHTFDLDLQHHVILGTRHDIVWGLEYRFTTDQTTGSLTISFNPSSRGDHFFNAFLQDEVVLFPDRLRLMLGTKFDDNPYSGLEILPNFRLLWTPHPHHAVWAAFSKADRVPSRADAGLRLNLAAFPGAGGTTNLLALLGNPQLEDEHVWANELGYRAQLSKRLSLDLATFYNSYDDLRSSVPGTPFFESTPPLPHLVLPLVFQNALRGETHGVEAAASWQAASRWKLSGGYTWFQPRLGRIASVGNASTTTTTENSPHQWNLRSNLNLPRRLELDTSLYYVGRLSNAGIPSYVRFDGRLGWRPTESLEISVVLQNLLDDRHPEFGSPRQAVEATEVKRSAYAKLTWRF